MDILGALQILKSYTVDGVEVYIVVAPIIWAFDHAPGSKKNNLRRTFAEIYSKFRQPR